MAVNNTIIWAAGILAVVVEARLVKRIVQTRRRKDGTRMRSLTLQATGVLLMSADILVRLWGRSPGGARVVTGILFWAGLALIALGLILQLAVRPKKED